MIDPVSDSALPRTFCTPSDERLVLSAWGWDMDMTPQNLALSSVGQFRSAHGEERLRRLSTSGSNTEKAGTELTSISLGLESLGVRN